MPAAVWTFSRQSKVLLLFCTGLVSCYMLPTQSFSFHLCWIHLRLQTDKRLPRSYGVFLLQLTDTFDVCWICQFHSQQFILVYLRKQGNSSLMSWGWSTTHTTALFSPLANLHRTRTFLRSPHAHSSVLYAIERGIISSLRKKCLDHEFSLCHHGTREPLCPPGKMDTVALLRR